jgi:formate hydrogenlyase subunit 4
VFAADHFPFSGFIMLALLLFALQAFLKRLPFDIAEAETEIMEGPMVEYSGPKLALFKHAQMAKLILYGAILINLFLPWGNQFAFPLSFGIFWLKVLVLVLLATWIAATHARYRIDQAVRAFAVLLGISGIALVLATLGY